MPDAGPTPLSPGSNENTGGMAPVTIGCERFLYGRSAIYFRRALV